MLTAAGYNQESSKVGISFLVIDTFSNLIYAGSCGCPVDSAMDADAKGLCFALQGQINLKRTIKTILSTNEELVKAIKQKGSLEAWRMNIQINIIKDLIVTMGNPRLQVIPKCWNRATSSLAIHVLSHHEIFLFHQGPQLPKCIMKSLRQNGVLCQLLLSFYLFCFLYLIVVLQVLVCNMKPFVNLFF